MIDHSNARIQNTLDSTAFPNTTLPGVVADMQMTRMNHAFYGAPRTRAPPPAASTAPLAYIFAAVPPGLAPHYLLLYFAAAAPTPPRYLLRTTLTPRRAAHALTLTHTAQHMRLRTCALRIRAIPTTYPFLPPST